MSPTLPTTYLFVPADRLDRLPKARASGADMVILDLEDAVGTDMKDAARASAEAVLSNASHRACLRINGTETQWFEDDCRLLALPGVAGVMVPKAETTTGLAAVRAVLPESVPMIPLIETARGLAAAGDLARCAGVLQLAFGSVDFQLDLGIEGEDLELLFARSQLVLSSRVAGIGAPVDGVSLAINDVERVRNDAIRARRLGFSGKLCIHPAQIAAVHEAFQPSSKDVAWAQGVLDAAMATQAGASTYEGKMVDKPVIERARAILRRRSSS